MRDDRVVEAVRPTFEQDKTWSDVDQSNSMFLFVPHMFAHIVLRDASKYEVAMNALRRIETTLDEKFEWRLRSSWKIGRVEYRGAYYNKDGLLCAASEIYVELSSGSRIARLRVAFTSQASEDLARVTGSAPDDYEAHKRQAVEKTRKYLELLVDAGGEMAWDPLWPGGDQLTINSSALAWILQEETRLAVD